MNATAPLLHCDVWVSQIVRKFSLAGEIPIGKKPVARLFFHGKKGDQFQVDRNGSEEDALVRPDRELR